MTLTMNGVSKPKRKHNIRCRFWLFTINNPDGLIDINDFKGDARYLIYQEEIGEDTHTHHLQCYVEMKTQKSMLAMKKYFPQAHWDIRKGTQEQAIAYCSKSDTNIGGPYEFGTKSVEKGHRSDLDALKADIMKGDSIKQISEKYFSDFIRYHKGIERFIGLHGAKKTWKCPITVVIGESGSGKSYYVQNTLLKDYHTYWKDGSMWWPFYEGTENAVVFDEFVGCWNPYEFNRMYDPTPYSVQIKGGNMPFLAKKMVVISNYHPKSWWSKTEYWPAFERRVECWIMCTKRVINGNQAVYERQEKTSWSEFEDLLEKAHVPLKPSKEDK